MASILAPPLTGRVAQRTLYIHAAIFCIMKRRDDENVWEFFNERAAIMRYDGGLALCDAEFYALARARHYFGARGIQLPYSGYFYIFKDTELGWSDEEGRAVVFPCPQVLAQMALAAIREADDAGRPYSCWLAWRKRDR
ncbi:hypothetical protein [Burkholderia pseudomallei]|uniref:hypothetical protein n=1 Tax=Burkholderia pseudomallei TaxID=28450 RepID=UPI001E34388E|nr:hypothetical protein [Burkholderia pseudomallei]